jgi:hypothetical protein
LVVLSGVLDPHPDGSDRVVVPPVGRDGIGNGPHCDRYRFSKKIDMALVYVHVILVDLFVLLLLF